MSRPSLAEDASPDAFAAAMIACRGYAPNCSDLNECAYGGECFTPDKAARRAAIRKLRDLIAKEANGAVSLWLQVALESIESAANAKGET